MTNSNRLESLVRAGNLYVSAQDVIALALENNLDIEIQRYGPVLTREVTKRARGGGILRNVGVGVAQGPQSVSLTGVSLNASGGATGAAGTVGSSGGIITQLGPSIPNLDPNLSLVANFSHSTSVQSNTVLTGTTALTDDTRSYQAVFGQTLDFGLNYQLTYASTRNKFNSSFFTVNPYDQGDLDLQVSQPLLQGFGRAVIGRNILISKNNEKYADLQFKQQVITTVSAVLNLYWDLVAFYQDLRAKKDELATAQALFSDNKKQVEIGTLAPIEVTRAEAQVYASQQDLLVSQTNLLQQETVLKNALSKNGVASPTLADVHVIPLDTIQVPEKDESKPVNELVGDALHQRVEILQSTINIDSNKKNLVGIKNGLKPNLSAFFELTNNGLAGVAGPFFNPAAAGLVGNYNSSAGRNFQARLPKLLSRVFFEHSSSQQGGASRLRDQRTGIAPDRITVSEDHQSGARGRSKRRNRIAAGAGKVRLGCQGTYFAAANARCGQEEIYAWAPRRCFRWLPISKHSPRPKARKPRRLPTTAMPGLPSIRRWAPLSL